MAQQKEHPLNKKVDGIISESPFGTSVGVVVRRLLQERQTTLDEIEEAISPAYIKQGLAEKWASILQASKESHAGLASLAERKVKEYTKMK